MTTMKMQIISTVMPTSKNATIILGIDPGLADTGFGVISQEKGNLRMLDFGTIKTKAGLPDKQRLMEIHDGLTQLIKKYRPTVISVEKLFFCKNIKTAIAVGQARGVVILTAGQNNLEVLEFTPLQIKQATTGYGQASKQQIKSMVKTILKLSTIPKSDDAADALAAAICCSSSRRPKIAKM